jgi:hypothetical protein
MGVVGADTPIPTNSVLTSARKCGEEDHTNAEQA